MAAELLDGRPVHWADKAGKCGRNDQKQSDFREVTVCFWAEEYRCRSTGGRDIGKILPRLIYGDEYNLRNEEKTQWRPLLIYLFIFVYEWILKISCIE